MSAPDHVVTALAALAHDDFPGAAAAASRAAAQGSLVGAALDAYLPAVLGAVRPSVYDEPAAFQAFVDGGGNVPLYEAVSDTLAGLYSVYDVRSLVDLGCGDGRAVLPALRRARPGVTSVDLVEPAADLLADARTRAADLPVEIRTWPQTAQDFLRQPGNEWELAESTFALHALEPAVRRAVLAALRPRVGHLAVVEFDVPDLSGDERLEFLATTYERGLSEYDADRNLVAQGFLLPVLVGQLRPGAARQTYEQPAPAWLADLETAGWTDVAVVPVADYWSSPAFLLTANA